MGRGKPKSRRKRTPELDATIRAEIAKGLGVRTVAANHGISTGLVSAITRSAPPAPPLAASSYAAPAHALDDASLTIAERVTLDLERQATLLRAEGDRQLAAGDNSGFAATSRILSGVLKTLAGLAPEREHEGTYVTNQTMNDAAASARAKMHKLIDSLERVSKSTLGERIVRLLAER